jgi:non-reducing end alpha-L-arabinofuranosidase
MKKKNYPVFALALPVAVILMAMSGGEKKAAVLPRPKGSCDIYAAGGTPCVAAHSTTRALYAAYNGPLYQVMRQADSKTLDIGIVQSTDNDAGGYANAAAQDAFCGDGLCWISKVYDQSGKGNHLVEAPPGTFKGSAKGEYDYLPIADMAPITIGGHKAYGVYIMPGMGLRNNNARDLAINDEPEGIYYVINGKHFDSGCCFDYGNSSTNSRAVGTGTMETTYYGTSTAWGSGNGTGPWIMADMEAGLFSGYNAKKNDVSSIDSWKFVSAFVDGGGGNKWDLRGGNAQEGKLTTYYDGVRPGTPNSKSYFPMNKKGGILLGNGGDNGNGSAGTFYEGVMTTGYPTMATTDAVQANIVAAKYDVQRVSLSRLTTFAPKTSQEVTVSFTNTTDAPVTNINLSIAPRNGWTSVVKGSASTSKTIEGPIAPGNTVSATFKVTSPAIADGGVLTGRVAWTNFNTKIARVETIKQRVRNASPVKINEVRFRTGSSLTDQFIELYNASSTPVDISNWSIVSTPGGWASVKLATIPAGTKLAGKSFYLLGMGSTGLVAPTALGANVIHVENATNFAAGQQINVDGESRTIANVGTSASPMTTLYIPVSTSSKLVIAAGATNIPVTSAAGFTVGQKIGIDFGGNYEIATVTAVGKAATQTTLFAAANKGSSTIKVADNANMTAGDIITINTGARVENVTVKRIVNVVAAPVGGRGRGEGGEVELSAPLKMDHMADVDVYGPGTGISFTPATKFNHQSADAVQALGTGITLQSKLAKNHKAGAAVINNQATTIGYQGTQKPNQWFGAPLSSVAGSIALMDASGKVLVDGLVYGSQQSNSSANGYITSPEIATLEGEQVQGGCIVALPGSAARQVPTANANDQTNISVGRFPDGNDNDSNCSDFQVQKSITLAVPAMGEANVKINSVTGFSAGQKVVVGTGTNSETATIATVGTTGGTSLNAATDPGVTTIPVISAAGFMPGQTITIGEGATRETVVVNTATAVRRRPGAPGAAGGTGDSITLLAPLKYTHAAGAQVSGSGITFTAPLTKHHNAGTQILSAAPTPGAANQYAGK